MNIAGPCFPVIAFCVPLITFAKNSDTSLSMLSSTSKTVENLTSAILFHFR